ncbi:MAG TPA: protein translocase subunit SecDF [Cyclobacteriaceae bacterium]|nr:protein translocase subunit SecDF [Cyclobacteriaceae bacterium]
MRNKGVVIVLTIIITALCLYYLSFTLVTYKVNQEAIEYATSKDGTVELQRKQHYLDSLWNKPVYDLLGAEFTYKEVKDNELALGLDLQGGMHVVLEVSPSDIIKGLAGNSPDPIFVDALRNARERQKTSTASFAELFRQEFKKLSPGQSMASLFASSANKDRIRQNADDDAVVAFLDKEIEEAINRSYTILKTRIDQFGTSQPSVQRLQGSGGIQIEVPGADNPQRIKKLLQGVARLEFWDVIEPSDPVMGPVLSAINTTLLKEQQAERKAAGTTTTEKKPQTDLSALSADTTKSDLENQLAATDSSRAANLLDSLRSSGLSPLISLSSQEAPFLYNIRDTSTISASLRRESVKNILRSKNIGWFWDVKPQQEVTPGTEDLFLNFVNLGRTGKPLLSGEVITDARADFDQYARNAVSMNMSPTGARTWAKMTAAAAAKQPRGRIAIVLDNFVYTAPSVQGEIPNGNSQITGSFETEEAKDLANVLKAGSLPAPTRIVEEAIVGPTLGNVAANQGLISMAAGLVLVVIFMVAYYSKGGWVANIALLFNIFFILGILAQLDAALTLPGIAGIVLTMGMAVDANVLIYERIKEELKAGRRLVDAINTGYKRAFASIFDSNLTTLITTIFLFVLGQGPLKGFGITLMVGIATSFFTSVYISRVIVEWMVRKGDQSKLSFDSPLARMWSGRRNYDFIGMRKINYIVSSGIIVVGFIFILINGLNLGVDFKGGRSYIVTFNQPVDATSMRTALSNSFEGAGTEVKNYDGNTSLKVTTSWLIDDDTEETADRVKTALIAGLEGATGKQYQENPRNLDDTHFTIGSSSKVGATVADDIKGSAWKASLFSLLGIFFYILLRFKGLSYSVGAVVATVHDTLFVFAAFGIAGALGFGFEVDQVFVAAILTVIGYSINDTVIIFDRIREYLSFGANHDKHKVFNEAINSTLSRTLITSGTTLIVVVVLLFFGGEVMRGFSFALLIGIGVGTYSSIFIAAPVVLDFDRQVAKKSSKTTSEPKLVTKPV